MFAKMWTDDVLRMLQNNQGTQLRKEKSNSIQNESIIRLAMYFEVIELIFREKNISTKEKGCATSQN